MYTIICASILHKDLNFLSNLNHTDVADILICYPSACYSPLQLIDNVHYLSCPSLGQVAQRIFALRFVKTPYVIFIDDDIEINTSVFDKIISNHQSLAKPESSALGIVIKARIESQSILHSYNSFFYRLLSIVEGVSISSLMRPGSLSPLMFNKPHEYGHDYQPLAKSDWISGGFIIFPYQYLDPNTSYYPFRGKAFSEDIYLSCHLSSNNVQLYYISNQYLLTNIISSSFALANFRAKFSLLSRSDLKFKHSRFILSYFLRILSYLFR